MGPDRRHRKLECDHGRYRAPGCWPPGTTNTAGARGPMQFLGSTWRTDADTHTVEVAGPPAPDGHGYATDGDGDQIADPWNSYDAAHATARYLVDLGGRDDPHTAARHYNAGPNNPNPHAGLDYADQAIEIAARYRTLATDAPTGDVTHDAEPGPAVGGGCTVADPTGTGGCVTPRTAHLVGQLQTAHGSLPMWCFAPRPGNPTSDHPQGRACDITFGAIGRHPTATERTHGWHVANWLTTNAHPLHLDYIIWDGLIWTGTDWRGYHGGGIYNPDSPTGGHYDHIHISVAA